MKSSCFWLLLLGLTWWTAGCTATPEVPATSLPSPTVISPTSTPALPPSDQANVVTPTASSATPPVMATPAPTLTTTMLPTPIPESSFLIVTQAQDHHIAWVDPQQGMVDQVEVGAAPWGMALAPEGRLYVATAEGVAVVDLSQRERLALVPYQAELGPPQFGEYRPGGMGIAISPDGRQVYVGVYLQGQASQLEILEIETLAMVASVPVGIRPFEVLVSRDGREVFTIDHDSYSITAVDPVTLEARTIEVAPLGRGAFDKPHYAAQDSQGKLWLPFQGKALVYLEPASGQFTTFPLTANTHQHGVAVTPDERFLLIVGTGAAGEVTEGPSLTLFETQTMTEAVLPLAQPHEKVVVSPDGRSAYLSGGYLLTGGWDGIAVVDLQTRTTREVAVPASPLDMIILP
jgi:DNA-binding beta-propeller fold protein YncE